MAAASIAFPARPAMTARCSTSGHWAKDYYQWRGAASRRYIAAIRSAGRAAARLSSRHRGADSLSMPAAFAAVFNRLRSVSLSIGQLTFGSFLLLLAVITATSMASVIAIRHIDTTFTELQRLQDVGGFAEEIDRRMNELRLAARDFVTDPGAQSDRVGEAAGELNTLLKKTRLKLAPDQQAMIDGVSQRLANYREGSDRVGELIGRRAELLSTLPAARGRIESAITQIPDRNTARALFRLQNQISSALLARDPAAAEQAARGMLTVKIDDPGMRSAVDEYANRIIAIAATEDSISQLDKEVLGTEGRLIGRVTELLRALSAEQGKVLSRDFARTLAEAKWQSIILGSAGV